MIYYKAICNVTRPESDECGGKQSHSKITAAVRAATEYLHERCAGAFYLFAADWECDVAVLGILSRQAIDGEPFAREFFGELGTDAENIRVREVTFHDISNLLADAKETGYIDSDSEILDLFGLPKLYTGRRMSLCFGENLISIRSRDEIVSGIDGCLMKNSMTEELDRIYDERAAANVIGHPVHYLMEIDEPETRKLLCRSLLSALYGCHRLQNRRYCYIDIDADVPFSVFEYKTMYRSCIGGTVWVRLNAREDAEDGGAVSGEYDTVWKICSVLKEYRNRVLTIVCFPRACAGLRKIFYENLDSVSIVELREDPAHDDTARDYLSTLAGRNNVTDCADLLSRVETGKSYTSAELDALFDRWFDETLKSRFFPQYGGVAVVTNEHPERAPIGSAYQKLTDMVGLDEAKSVIRKAVAYYKMRKTYGNRRPNFNHTGMHMVFTGNPGTAKTTVARLFAEILKENEILPTCRLVEVGRGDLVGKYVGWTANIVKEKFRLACGGVLFIDEAYSLVDGTNGSYGDEAINTIVQEMENNRDKVIVIFAGYPNEMEQFLRRNPGLRSRIAFHVPFADYSADELCRITELLGKESGLEVSADALEKLNGVFRSALREPDFGNGRYARNLLEQAEMNLAVRVMGMDPAAVTERDTRTIIAEDVEVPTARNPAHKSIGFM